MGKVIILLSLLSGFFLFFVLNRALDARTSIPGRNWTCRVSRRWRETRSWPLLALFL